MSNYEQPPRPRGATTRELVVIDEAYRLSSLSADKGAQFALREAVNLIVKLIAERGTRRDFLQRYDRPHED